jgi:hypothetical protein
MPKPCPELTRVLAKAYPTCPNLKGPCKQVTCVSDDGLVPRGYSGAFGTARNVRLVLVLAEPGTPQPGTQSQSVDGDPAKVVANIATGVRDAFETGATAFHRNVRSILDACWPNLQFAEQMKRTWITESVLCSAAKSCSGFSREVESACATMYLSPQLQALSGAFVVCLGGKAARRLRTAGLRYDVKAAAPGLPGGNTERSKKTWLRLGKRFQQFLQR